MPNKVTTVATSVSAAFAGGFSFPHVGGPRVIFSGYGGGSSDTQVLAAFAGDKVSDLLSAGGSHARFAGVADASSTTSATAFVGQAETATGVYILRDRRLATIATSAKSGFDGLSDPSLSSSSGLSSISFIGKKGSFRGLFIGRAWDDGRLTGAGDPTLLHELVNSTRSIPTQTASAPLACIQSPALSLPAGVVAFFGSSCDGDANSLRDSGRFRRSVTLKDHAIKPSAPANRAAGIFLVRVPKQDAKWPKPGSAQIEVVADYTTAVPAPTPVSAAAAADNTTARPAFVGFSAPIVGAAGNNVAFVGQTSTGALGIFVYRLDQNLLQQVVDTGTPVPGGLGTFGDFPYPPSIHEDTLVFYAAAGGATSGIYVARHCKTGPSMWCVQPVITLADQINGEPIVFLGLGGGAFDGKSATFYAVTSIDGVYTVKVDS